MDLLRSRKFRMLVCGVILVLYIAERTTPYPGDVVMLTLGLMVGMYTVAVAIEDGMRGN